MKKYNVIYADPSWTYKTYSKECETEFAKKHYPTTRGQLGDLLTEITVKEMDTADAEGLNQNARYLPRAFSVFLYLNISECPEAGKTHL